MASESVGVEENEIPRDDRQATAARVPAAGGKSQERGNTEGSICKTLSSRWYTSVPAVTLPRVVVVPPKIF